MYTFLDEVKRGDFKGEQKNTMNFIGGKVLRTTDIIGDQFKSIGISNRYTEFSYLDKYISTKTEKNL